MISSLNWNDGSEIRAILFDMDGTIIDSEPYTGLAIFKYFASQGTPLDTDFDTSQYHGRTWESIALDLKDRFPTLLPPTPEALNEIFENELVSNPAPFINGAPHAIKKAMMKLKVGIATSSNRESVKHLLQRLGENSVDDFVAAEDYSESKPNPECFLLLASRLGVKPSQCLVSRR